MLFFSPLPPSPNINISLGDEPETSPQLVPLKLLQNWWVLGHPSVNSPELTQIWRAGGTPVSLLTGGVVCAGPWQENGGGQSFVSLGSSMLQGLTLAPCLPALLPGTDHQLPGSGLVNTDPIPTVTGRSLSCCLGSSCSHPAREQMGRSRVGHHPQSVLGGARR